MNGENNNAIVVTHTTSYRSPFLIYNRFLRACPIFNLHTSKDYNSVEYYKILLCDHPLNLTRGQKYKVYSPW